MQIAKFLNRSFAGVVLVAFAFALDAKAATLVNLNWNSYDLGTPLSTIGWSAMAESANTPVIGAEASNPNDHFLTTGPENNQSSRHFLSFTNPGFDNSTKLTFTVDLFDPLVNSQSALSTFPRAVLGMYELDNGVSMPSYFGLEHSDSSANDTTAEWVVSGENFGTPAAPQKFTAEGSVAQDTWYTVRSVWDFATRTKSLEVKPRGSTAQFTPIFMDEALGFTDVNQDPAALNAVGLRMNRGTRMDNLRVEYTLPALKGDYNSDLVVDAADYTLWRNTLGSSTDLRADGDGNGQIQQADYGVWREHFGDSRLPKHLSSYASAPAEIVGGPERSDVMFSVRSFYSSPGNYAAVADAFHATRNDWTYAASIQQGVDALAANGATSGGAMHASLHDLPDTHPGIIRQWDGVTPLSHWGDDRYSGDVNDPGYRAAAYQILKGYVDAGNVRVQWDDPRFNTEYVLDRGGSFTAASVVKYRDWLQTNTTPGQRNTAGLPTNLAGFDYREFVAARNGNVTAAATELWMTFHYESSIEFLNWIDDAIDEYAGFDVLFTGNNLGHWDIFPTINTDRQEYINLYRWFDYGIAELYAPDQNPKFIFDSVRRAEELGKRQAFTLVSTDVLLNRQVMAYSYAVGGHMVMPWDVYVPNSPRFFGDPNDYNDITAFVRENAELFDDYETASFLGPGLFDASTALLEPMLVAGGSGQIYAIARAIPDDETAPIVVHLVDWDASPIAFELRLRNEMFGWSTDEEIVAQLLRPGFADLSLTGTLLAGGYTSFALPALSPYGLLVIAPPLLYATAIPEPGSLLLILPLSACLAMRSRWMVRVSGLRY